MATSPPSDNIFVGDLPTWLTQEQFEGIMKNYGTVVSVKVLPPKGTKASGLVRMSSPEEAQWVVENLNGNIAEGLEEPVTVRFANTPGGAAVPAKGAWGAPAKGAAKGAWGAPAKGAWGAPAVEAPPPSNNVFVGGLPADCTQELFQQIMSQYGSLSTCKLMPAKVPGGKTSGLVRFESVAEATWVCENLNNNLAEGLTEPVKVRFANAPAAAGKGAWGLLAMGPYGGKGWGGCGCGKGGGSFYYLYGAIKKAGLLGGAPGELIPEECQVYIKNLPPDTTNLDLYRLFAPFGAISHMGVKAMTNEDGSCKGIGFVNFSDPQHALVACQSLNGFTMPDGSWLGVSQNIKNKGGGKGKVEGA